jgi:hypothetical protein
MELPRLRCQDHADNELKETFLLTSHLHRLVSLPSSERLPWETSSSPRSVPRE